MSLINDALKRTQQRTEGDSAPGLDELGVRPSDPASPHPERGGQGRTPWIMLGTVALVAGGWVRGDRPCRPVMECLRTSRGHEMDSRRGLPGHDRRWNHTRGLGRVGRGITVLGDGEASVLMQAGRVNDPAFESYR